MAEFEPVETKTIRLIGSIYGEWASGLVTPHKALDSIEDLILSIKGYWRCPECQEIFNSKSFRKVVCGKGLCYSCYWEKMESLRSICSDCPYAAYDVNGFVTCDPPMGECRIDVLKDDLSDDNCRLNEDGGVTKIDDVPAVDGGV